MPSKPLDLPIAIAKAFVRDMRAFPLAILITDLELGLVTARATSGERSTDTFPFASHWQTARNRLEVAGVSEAPNAEMAPS
jgi:hypothetical protein